MSLCLMNHAGELLLHRPMPAAPDPWLQALAPYRDGLLGAVACLCPWSWLADRCAPEGMACVRGPALSLPAIHGGKAKNDQSASPKIAALRRGGRRPQASGSPADLRAPRDLVRRRLPLMRPRAALLAHGQNPTRQSTRPEIGKQRA
jgi:hypothetical protein